MQGGFAIRRYGRLDHLVATGGNMGNGTGEVLLAVVLQHRGGSADRVPDDTTKQNFLNYLVSAGAMADVLRSMLETYETMPFAVRYPLDADMQRAKQLLGPLVDWDKLTGAQPPAEPTPEYTGAWGVWIAERDGWMTDHNATILEFPTKVAARDHIAGLAPGSDHYDEMLSVRPLDDSGFKIIAMAAGFRLNHVVEGDEDGGYFYWYTPGFNIDEPRYREGDVTVGEDDAWRDCCIVNDLFR